MTDALAVRAETPDGSGTAPCACCAPPADAASEIEELERKRAAVERRLAELESQG
ncbi:MAG TPA: hypothetical protein VM264_08690 [Acidimicrobiales bacterium]|nr:hypothetical protein [Acidimicrobiales bacterium]